MVAGYHIQFGSAGANGSSLWIITLMTSGTMVRAGHIGLSRPRRSRGRRRPTEPTEAEPRPPPADRADRGVRGEAEAAADRLSPGRDFAAPLIAPLSGSCG